MSDRVLVTGGAGFIGSHLCRLLVDQGHHVTVVDNLSVGKRERVPPGAELLVEDVLDSDRMQRIVADRHIGKICHLAARVSIRASTDGFREDAEINILGTLSMLQAAVKSDVRKFVFASSMAVYADSPTPDPVAENFSTAAISPYGISKLASERFIENILTQSGREHISLRFFNTYGPNQTYTPYVGVITIFINKLLSGEDPVVFGDGEQIRDFVYVGDIAAGVAAALETESVCGVFNLGSGRPRSVNQIADLLRRKIDPSRTIAYAPKKPGEITNSVANIAAARGALGYHPTGVLEDRIDEVIDAIRSERSRSTQNG